MTPRSGSKPLAKTVKQGLVLAREPDQSAQMKAAESFGEYASIWFAAGKL